MTNSEKILRFLNSDPDKYWSNDELNTKFPKLSPEEIEVCVKRLQHKELIAFHAFFGGFTVRTNNSGLFYFEDDASEKSKKWAERRWGLTQLLLSNFASGLIGLGAGYLLFYLTH
ncbi:MAG: hypothetical protein WCQ53_08500 [bacterium]